MKTILLLAAAIGAMSAAPAMAQTPTQRGPDARIREVNYTDGNVIQIRSAFRTATQIEFAPGEVIKFVAMGDTVSWEVAPADNSLRSEESRVGKECARQGRSGGSPYH